MTLQIAIHCFKTLCQNAPAR